uniref:Uncharacterized protein n=1 Tax=Neobodo designis TaxID=312471 RepID=A0A7S1LI93_NEODS
MSGSASNSAPVDSADQPRSIARALMDVVRADPMWVLNAALLAFVVRLHWGYAHAALVAAELRQAAAAAAAAAASANNSTAPEAAPLVPVQLQFASFIAVLLLAVVLRRALAAIDESTVATDQAVADNTSPVARSPEAAPQPDWETVSEESGSLQRGAANVTRGSAVAAQEARERSVSTHSGAAAADLTAASGVDSAVMANMDDVYAMLAGLNARREAALEGARMSADEFEALRQDVHRELFCGSPVSALATEDALRGSAPASRSVSASAGWEPAPQPPTPNASTVRGEAATAPPSATSFDIGAPRSRSPSGGKAADAGPEPMLDVLRAAVAESMRAHQAHHHQGHAAPDVDVEALYHAYCTDADDTDGAAAR